MTSPVLIYDGDCPYCSMAAVALERLDDIAALSWYADPVEAFLHAQFDAQPFAMILVDPGRETVYAGRSAAQELADRAGTPEIVGSLVRQNYETIAGVVGSLTRRGRDPADYHDQYPLAAAAKPNLQRLEVAATADAQTAVSSATDGTDAESHS